MLHRYVIHELVGRGGMGSVYRATDRLTSQVVALKQLTLPTHFQQLSPSEIDKTVVADSTSGTIVLETALTRSEERLRVSLTREFQTLASLRHPHIISVLDYGFNQSGLPYFTMSYLDEPRTILEAGKGLEVPEKVKLLQQMLSALAYLHRRGILHGDLKPDNVLVSGDGVKVLDFGLAKAKGTQVDSTISGTFLYMAPEVLLKGSPITEAADLYAVGLMAYELFAGKHPFNSTDNILMQLLTETPDLTQLPVSLELRQVVGKLLAMEPEERYSKALEAIADLSEAAGLPLPEESEAIRESFLQAARFVGRKVEMKRLMKAMYQARKGKGSSWLVGGESGVGKTRLLDELRIRALVDGGQVLRGQAVKDGGGIPLQLWRAVVRRLVLGTGLSELAIGVLQSVVPDIDVLLDEEVVPPPVLPAEAEQQRLFGMVVDLFRSQGRWMLLILEDLQWSAESLLILKLLNQVVADLPLMIVGTYRNDEKPSLPEELPAMEVMILQRFSTKEMAKLSTAILGTVGQQVEVLELLQRETEGNVFFLVEVVRALAEEAGRLGDIGKMVLPEKLFPKGIQTIVERRLAHISGVDRLLLKGAAVAGRELDERVLAQLAQDRFFSIDIERWLRICAEASVLELAEGGWRFAHDKLRQGMLAQLAHLERQNWHRYTAQAIEKVYVDDEAQAGILAYHWGEAGDIERERMYAEIAGNYAAKHFNNDEAIRYLSRALALTDEFDGYRQYELLLVREKVYDLQGVRDAQIVDLEALSQLGEQLGEKEQAAIYLRQAQYHAAINSYQQAIDDVKGVLALLKDVSNHTNLHMDAYYLWGNALLLQASFAEAKEKFMYAYQLAQETSDQFSSLRALAKLGLTSRQQGADEQAYQHFDSLIRMSQDINYPQGELEGLHGLGVLAEQRENLEEAYRYFEQSKAICQRIGHRLEEANQLTKLGLIAEKQHEYDKAQTYFEETMPIYQAAGNRAGVCFVLANLGFLSWRLGQYQLATDLYKRGILIAQELGFEYSRGLSFVNLGHIFRDLGDYVASKEHYQQALQIFGEFNDPTNMSYIFNGLGIVLYDMGQYEDAKQAYLESMERRRQAERLALVMEDLVGLAQIAQVQNQLEEAMSYLDEVFVYLKENPTMQGAERPFRVLLICIQILRALGDERALTFLEKAYAFLQEQASHIANEQARVSFLQNVPAHRELIQLYQTVSELMVQQKAIV